MSHPSDSVPQSYRRSLYDPARHNRQSTRLKGYDYAQMGSYFITLCTHNRERLFGDIVDGVMVLNEWGNVVHQCWQEIPNHFPHAALDEFIVMPNHVHVIIVINGAAPVGARHASPLQPQKQSKINTMGTIIGGFKSATTKRINEIRQTPGRPIWQRNFYDHIIRSQRAYDRIRTYIHNNPAKWELDHR